MRTGHKIAVEKHKNPTKSIEKPGGKILRRVENDERTRRDDQGKWGAAVGGRLINTEGVELTINEFTNLRK